MTQPLGQPVAADPVQRPELRSRVVAGPIRRTLLLLALPVLAEQVLNTFVGIFDTFLAGRISATATAAIGLGAYVSWLAEMLVMLVAIGATALISRMKGAGQDRDADRVTAQSLLLAGVLGAVLTVLLYTMAPTFARLQRMSGESFLISVEFLRLDALAMVFHSLTLVGCACLRGAGNMRTPMAVFVVINVVNIVASPALVYGWGPFPQCGVTGIVGGTIAARIIGGVLVTAVLLRGRAGLHSRWDDMRPRLAIVWRILRIGLPAAGDGLVLWTGHFIFISMIARLAPGIIGQAYFAASIIGVRVEALTYLPAVAWGAASATMIGQALGAGDVRRARRVGHEAVLQCGLLAVGMAAVFYFGAEAIFAVMSDDVLVRAAGVDPLRCVGLLQPLLVISIVYVHSLRGAGDTRVPALITILGTFVVRLPCAWYFGLHLEGGLLGAWIGMFGDMITRATLATVRYTSGRWVGIKV